VSFVYIYCKEDQAEAEAGGPQSKYVMKQTLGRYAPLLSRRRRQR